MDEERKYCVYMHTNKENDKKYVGITCQKPETRWHYGKGYAPNKKQKQQNTVFYNAILKYGWDNFKHEILSENLTKDEAYKLEQELIILYNSKKPNGYNLTDGGYGTIGAIITEERRRKISESLKKRYETMESASKGRKLSPEHIEKLKNRPVKRGKDSAWYGRKHTEESKKKVSNGLKEYFKTHDNSHMSPVWQYSIGGKFIREWKSISSICKELGCDGSSISACCTGKYKKSGGFIWRYKGDSFEKYEVKRKNISGENSPYSISIKMFDFEGNFISLFCSIKEATNKTNISRDMISKCCKGITNMAGGYIWRFEADEFDKYKIEMPRKVVQYNLNNEKISEFKSCKEASRKTGLLYQQINNCCLSKIESYKGYVFKYE